MGEFVMPSLGADMAEGTFIEWLVAPGDRVRRGDIIAVVETPKSAVEVECFEDGTIAELMAHEGDVVPVGGVLARLNGGPTAEAAKAPEAAEAAAPMPAPPVEALPAEAAPAEARPPVARPSAAVHAAPPISPVVRHRAHELGIDLEAVTGTGRRGAVTRKDLERAAAARAAAAQPPPAEPTEPVARQRVSPYARRLAREAGVELAGIQGTGTAGAVRAEDVRAAGARRVAAGAQAPQPARPSTPAAPPPVAAQPRRADVDSMRQSIAALMTVSNREIPHYYLSTTIDMTAALDWTRRRNRELSVEERLVPSALLLVAAARSARAVPDLNGHWVDDRFQPSETVDLGLILSLRRGGLLVPAIPRADTLSVPEMMAAMRELTTRARAGRLRGSDLTQPSITVSNLGDQGVESVLGVIYPPQVALVGFGAVSERPWAVGGLLGVRPLVTATLAGDHRASDGAVGARYLKNIDRLLQRPEEL
jgi:pyruvate dehydrogenase E2 component (dihydrolipoamide acetyltransferase)